MDHLNWILQNVLDPSPNEILKVDSWNSLLPQILALHCSSIDFICKDAGDSCCSGWSYSYQGFFFCNLAGELVSMNPSFSSLLGVNGIEQRTPTLGELLASIEIMPLPEPNSKQCLALRAQLVLRDCWCLIFLRQVFVKESQEILIWGEVQDITPWRATYSRLQVATKEAEKANEAKSIFLAHMSHEIRTPMNAILGMAYLLSKTPLSVDQAEYIEKLGASAKTLLGIINDILDVSKIEAGKMELERREFSIQCLIEDVFNLVRIPAEDKGLRCYCRVVGAIPKFLRGDDLRIKQVLTNLANNAVKFTDRGEVVLSVELLNRVGTDQVQIRFVVEDTGIGLGEEEIQRVFQPFAQGDVSSTRKYLGTGLGLSISKQLVEMMGGVISVESELKKGSRLSFTLGLQATANELLVPENLNISKSNYFWFVDENQKAREGLDSVFKSVGLKGRALPSFHKMIEILPRELGSSPSDSIHSVFLDRSSWGQESVRHYLMNLKSTFEREGHRLRLVILMDFSKATAPSVSEVGCGVDHWMVRPIYPWVLLRNLYDLVQDQGEFSVGVRRIPRSDANVRLEGRLILMVEDNEVNQLVAQDILERVGAKVLLAPNGEQALKVLVESIDPIHLVLLDLQMPIMDGYETIKQIRLNSQWKDLPVIAMTAHALPEERRRCLALGMNDYLTKPVEPELMIKTLSRWCNPLVRDLATSELPQPIELSGSILWDLALKNTAGNRALLAEVAEKFIRDYGNSSGQLRQWLQEGKLVQAQRLLLSLKAIAGYIGANDLRRSSEVLENQIRQNKVEAMNQAWLIFDQQLRSVGAEIQKYLRETNLGILR